MKKTTKVKKSKVKTLFSPTAITQHLASRVRREADRVLWAIDTERTPVEKALIRKRRAKRIRVNALVEKKVDQITLGLVPASLEVLRDFKRQVAALR